LVLVGAGGCDTDFEEGFGFFEKVVAGFQVLPENDEGRIVLMGTVLDNLTIFL